MRFCIAFSAAIILSGFQTRLPGVTISMFLWMLSAVLLLGLWRFPAWRPWGAAILGAALGFAYVNQVAAWRLQQQLPPAMEQQDIELQVTVAGLPVQKDRYQQYLVEVTDGQPLPGHDVVLRKVLLNDYSRREIHPCEQWQMTVRLKRPHGLGNPAGFDYEAYLLEQNVQARGYVREASLVAPARGFCLHGIRQAWSDHVLARVPPENAAWIVALTTGDKSLMNEEQNLLLQETGTTHLFVISGSHIALCALAVYLLLMTLRRMGLGYIFSGDWRPFVALVALLVSAAYTALAGYGVPSQRSLIMLGVFLGAQIIGLEIALWLRFWLAMVCVLLVNPLSGLGVGFVLSFGAVLVLIVLAESLRAHDDGSGLVQRVRTFLRGLLWSQWFVFVGLLPFSLLYFSQVSLLAPLVNFIAVPAMSFPILPTLMLALFIWCVAGDDFGLLGLAQQQLEILFNLIEAGNQWGKAQVNTYPVLAFNAAMLGVLLLACMLMLLPPVFRTRLAGVVLLFAVLFSQPRQWQPEQVLQVDVLDVDQGLAVLVRTAKHQMLVDTGAAWPGGSMAGRAVKPYLVQQGIRQLDMVVISHLDNDHAGGVQELLGSFDVTEVLASENIPDIDARQCRAGQQWQWDGVTFRILHPDDPGNYWKRNNRSCVLLLEVAGRRILLPGDVEALVERDLVERLPEVDVMVAPHHGSKTSSTPDWAAKAANGIVIFSSGYLSQFRHPHPVVEDRYRSAGAKAYVTGLVGLVTIRVGQDGKLEAGGWREQEGRYWQKPVRRDNHSS